MLQMSKIKRQAASHFQPNLRAFQVLGSRGRFPKVLTESLSTNKDAIPKLNFTPLSAILLALIFMKCFSTLFKDSQRFSTNFQAHAFSMDFDIFSRISNGLHVFLTNVVIACNNISRCGHCCKRRTPKRSRATQKEGVDQQV